MIAVVSINFLLEVIADQYISLQISTIFYLNGQFNPVYSTASTIWDGGKSAIAIADINSDNQPEFIIGNLSGGIAYFNSDSLISDTTAAPQSWDCNAQGNCYDPGTGNGQYTSLIACSSVCLPVNIESTEDNFKIYPNPAKQKTTISSRSKRHCQNI